MDTIQERMDLDPALILADENSRFNLKKDRIDTLAEDILASGGVKQNIIVEPLPEPVDGKLYKLTAGFYRHAAVLQLIETKKASAMLIPALIEYEGSEVGRLKTQVKENLQRESLSPMDEAVAIKKLLDAGVPKIEVMKMFARPGGKKGNKLEPVSNSFINIRLSFLNFSKTIQNKIHSGELIVGAAYELAKASPDKHEEILARAEEARTKAFEKELREETGFLNAAKKDAAAQEKKDVAAKELEEKQKALQEAISKAEQLAANEAALYTQKKKGSKGDTEKEAIEKQFKEALEASQAQEKETERIRKEVDKLSGKLQTAEQHAAERAKKLADARKKSAKPSKSPSQSQVKKASTEAGAGTGLVKLNATQMREYIHFLSLPGGDDKPHVMVQQVGTLIKSAFDGSITDKQLFKELLKLFGAKK